MTVTSSPHIPRGDTLMSSPSFHTLHEFLTLNPLPYGVAILFLVVALVSVHTLSSNKDSTQKFPVLNPKRPFPFEILDTRSKREYDHNSFSMLYRAIKEFGGKPFRVLTSDFDEAIFLPPKYASELKNDRRFSFTKSLSKQFPSHLRGFEALKMFEQENRIIQLIAEQNTTQMMVKLTGPLSEECELALEEILTDRTDWQEVTAKSFILPLVARLSTVVFLGRDLAHNQDWIDITIRFAIVLMVSAKTVKSYPSFLRPIANLFLHECRVLREMQRRASEIVNAQLAQRQELRREGKAVELNNALEWYQKQWERLGGRYDPATAQLSLSLVAIHTTMDLLTQVVLDLAEHQELFEPLREEISQNTAGGGLTKMALYHMKLLDSVIKESQRLKPSQAGFMIREVLEDVTLSDDIHLKHGSSVMIMPRMRDPSLHEKPDEFDGYRFYRLRQEPGKENTSQLVAASPEHLGFGLGQHICPGRILASNEIKVALCHLLMKYDWKLAKEGQKQQWRMFGNLVECDPLAKILIRRRGSGEGTETSL